MHEKLQSVYFISLPESAERKIGSFELDPAILLPVELPSGSSPDEALSQLSWEMIIAAALKLLAWDPDHKDAEYYRQLVLAVQPDTLARLNSSAIVKARSMDYDMAEELFRAACRFDTEEEAPFLNLALLCEQKMELYRDQGNEVLAKDAMEEAEEAFSELIRIAPESHEARFHYGHFFFKIHRKAQAAEQLSAFMRLAPSDDERRSQVQKTIDALSGKQSDEDLFLEAYEAVRAQREEEGIDLIHHFLERNPRDWNAWFLLGWAFRRIGNYEKGKQALTQSLELKDDRADSYNELAICQLELGEYDSCLKTLTKALQEDQDNVKLLSNLAILHLKCGRESEARDCFNRVRQIDPEDPIARKYFQAKG